ncbi:hypothetical protein OIM90_01610 [Streptomyces sp. AD16]|nr:hypothetical protein OIM90_01610 [Streptomyces sp. AD16]
MQWSPVPLSDADTVADTPPVLACVGPGTPSDGLEGIASHHDSLTGLAEQLAAGRCPAPAYVLASVNQHPAVPGDAEEDTAGAAVAAAARALALVQSWLADDALSATGAKLVLLTRAAVAAGPGEGVRDLAGTPVWGLVRSAQSEHPGRFVLADLDHDPASLAALPSALSTGEPQLALRRGETLTPASPRYRRSPNYPMPTGGCGPYPEPHSTESPRSPPRRRPGRSASATYGSRSGPRVSTSVTY